MSKFTNISGVERGVIYGRTDAPGGSLVAPDTFIVVVDEADASYDCQPTIWKRIVEAPVAEAAPAEAAPAAAPVVPTA